MENHAKSMFPEVTLNNLGDVYESLGMFWSDAGCSKMLLVDFQKNRFFMIFDPPGVIHVTWRRVLRTPLPLPEGVPQVLQKNIE